MNPERFERVLWTIDGCRCEHWTRTDGIGESIRLYQADQLLSRRPFVTPDAVKKCAAEWQEIVALG